MIRWVKERLPGLVIWIRCHPKLALHHRNQKMLQIPQLDSCAAPSMSTLEIRLLIAPISGLVVQLKRSGILLQTRGVVMLCSNSKLMLMQCSNSKLMFMQCSNSKLMFMHDKRGRTMTHLHPRTSFVEKKFAILFEPPSLVKFQRTGLWNSKRTFHPQGRSRYKRWCSAAWSYTIR